MRVAVIGAGWAGLAAAVRLHQAGCQVQVYEAAPRPGGRARTIRPPGLGLDIDNGQHLLLGAYTDTLALMRSLDVDPHQAFHDRPLALYSADGRFRLRFWNLPAPWHHGGILLGSHGLDGWRGRWHLARVLRALDFAQIAPALTAADWLLALGCPPGLLERLWAPLCLAALNTPASQAEARLFARVLRDSLGAGRDASRLLIPRRSLHELWPAQACALLGSALVQQRARHLEQRADGGWRVDDMPCDRVVLAVPVGAAQSLLQSLPGAAGYLADWSPLRHSAIGTLTLKLRQPWRSGLDMALLHEDPARGAWGQWLFDRSATADQQQDQHLVHVVISGADRYAGLDADSLAAGITRQIRAQVRTPLPPVDAHCLVTEKRATFDALPGLHRPGTATPWPGLALAGDWTDTGYPAVLEGAVRSGLQAAAHVLQAASPP